MRILPSLLIVAALSVNAYAQSAATAEAEAAKCLDRIAGVQREVLGKYEDSLGELQNQFQKAADLDGALAVRAERQRMSAKHSLSEKDFVNEPRSLRAVQQQAVTKMTELTTALVNETVPKLVEMKKALTIGGRLDDAVSVRALIERLQNDNLRLDRADNGETVAADSLLTAYAADKARADKTYKGARIVVRGTVGGFRVDPLDPKQYIVYMTKGANAGWIACRFNIGNRSFREEKQFNQATLIVTDKTETIARIQAGQTIDIQGTGDGYDETVRLVKCEIVK